MITFSDFTNRFGTSLLDQEFQAFLTNTFVDLTEYNILESDYMVSEEMGLEIGFTNNAAEYDEDENIVFEKGDPVFSHFNIYPTSLKLISSLPFAINFSDKRADVMTKIGQPVKTYEGYLDLLNKSFLVDSYRLDNLIIAYDYDVNDQTINFIQVQDHNLVGLEL